MKFLYFILFICLNKSLLVFSFVISSKILSNPLALSQNHCEYSLSRQILPKAILIGVKKSGTYALLRYLGINPQIKAALKLNGCNANEIHYFDRDVNYLKGPQWYKNEMPFIRSKYNNCTHSFHNEYLVVEKTPGYFR